MKEIKVLTRFKQYTRISLCWLLSSLPCFYTCNVNINKTVLDHLQISVALRSLFGVFFAKCAMVGFRLSWLFDVFFPFPFYLLSVTIFSIVRAVFVFNHDIFTFRLNFNCFSDSSCVVLHVFEFQGESVSYCKAAIWWEFTLQMPSFVLEDYVDQ